MDFGNLLKHAINAMYVMIDIWICGMPVKILHFYVTQIYGFCYAFFTIVYWILGQGAIYSIMDWTRRPKTAAAYSVSLIVAVTPIFQCMFFLFHWLRVFLYEKCAPVKRVASDYDVESIAFEHDEHQIAIKTASTIGGK